MSPRQWSRPRMPYRRPSRGPAVTGLATTRVTGDRRFAEVRRFLGHRGSRCDGRDQPYWDGHADRSPTTVHLLTLGCARNEVDSEELAGRLAVDGFRLVAEPEDADAVLVNTCGFIETAKKDSVDTLLAAADLKDNGRTRAVVAVGCMAERYGAELAEAMPRPMPFSGSTRTRTWPAGSARSWPGSGPRPTLRATAGGCCRWPRSTRSRRRRARRPPGTGPPAGHGPSANGWPAERPHR